MTTFGSRTDNPAQRRIDGNRARRLQAVRLLEAMLKAACEPTFTGKIGVEMAVKDGVLGPPCTTQIAWPPD